MKPGGRGRAWTTTVPNSEGRMRERTARLRAIKTVIKKERIDSQEMLLARLEAEGFTVTQATLSRDLKLLKVGKVSDGRSSYYYALPGDEDQRESEKSLLQDLARGWVSVEFSGNLAVVKTLAGHANSVAYALDRLSLPEVLGSVAGDDTILLVLREDRKREELLASLRARFPEMEI